MTGREKNKKDYKSGSMSLYGKVYYLLDCLENYVIQTEAQEHGLNCFDEEMNTMPPYEVHRELMKIIEKQS